MFRFNSQGAYCSIHVATSPTLAGVGGKYFGNSEICKVSSAAQDREAAAKLWEISVKLTGL